MNNINPEQMQPALIIGGGIGGLCAAIALRQVGFDVHVYEQASASHELGAGLSIWPNALKALDQLGIGDKIRALSVEGVDAGSILTWDGRPLLDVSVRDITAQFGESVMIIHRADLHTLLLQSLPAETVHLSTRCTGFSQTANAVTVKFEDGTQASGAILIGADGLRSVIRQQLVPYNPLRYSGYTAWRSIVAFDHKRVARWGEYWGRGKRFGITAVSNDRVYWFCTENIPEGESRKIKGEERKAYLISRFGDWAAPIPSLLAESDPAAILSNDISDLSPLSRWADGRVALLGDAAHAMTPNLGQGACQAIEDAVFLGQCVRHEESIPAALMTYERKRLPHTRQIVALSRNIGSVAQWDNPFACAVRDFMISKMPSTISLNRMKSALTFAP